MANVVPVLRKSKHPFYLWWKSKHSSKNTRFGVSCTLLTWFFRNQSNISTYPFDNTQNEYSPSQQTIFEFVRSTTENSSCQQNNCFVQQESHASELFIAKSCSQSRKLWICGDILVVILNRLRMRANLGAKNKYYVFWQYNQNADPKCGPRGTKSGPRAENFRFCLHLNFAFTAFTEKKHSVSDSSDQLEPK